MLYNGRYYIQLLINYLSLVPYVATGEIHEYIW